MRMRGSSIWSGRWGEEAYGELFCLRVIDYMFSEFENPLAELGMGHPWVFGVGPAAWCACGVPQRSLNQQIPTLPQKPLLKCAAMYLLVIYLFGFLTATVSKKDNRKNINTKPNTDTHRPLPDRPIPVVCIQPPPSDQERAQQEKKNSRETIKFRIEIVGVVLLAVYTGFTVLTWWQVKESTEATGVAALAAKKSADIADYSFRVSAQPYMSIDFPVVDFSDSAIGKPITYLVVITNKGKTPANNVVCQLNVTSNWPVPLAGRPTVGKAVVYPDETFKCAAVTDFIFTKEIQRAYRTGTSKRYVHGFVSYDTLFTDTQNRPVSERHEYCFQYCPRLHSFTVCGEPNSGMNCY